MRKNIFKLLFISLFVAVLSSCSFVTELYYSYEIYLENCTNKSITIGIAEDPETVASKKYGACSFSKVVKSGKKVNSKAVVNDYYKITVDGDVIHSRTASESIRQDDFYLISGTGVVVRVYKDDSGYYFECESNF